MTLLVMKQHQRAASQDLAGTTDESSWDQVRSVNRLTMTIDVETRWFFSGVLPETSRPFSQHLGETLCATALG